MGVEYSAWIGFGIELTIIEDDIPEKYSGWSVEEWLEKELGDAPVRVVQGGTGNYSGGDAQWCIVAKDSHHNISFDLRSLQGVDRFLEPGWDMALATQVEEAMLTLRKIPWVKPNSSEASWIGAMWMH